MFHCKWKWHECECSRFSISHPESCWKRPIWDTMFVVSHFLYHFSKNITFFTPAWWGARAGAKSGPNPHLSTKVKMVLSNKNLPPVSCVIIWLSCKVKRWLDLRDILRMWWKTTFWKKIAELFVMLRLIWQLAFYAF